MEKAPKKAPARKKTTTASSAPRTRKSSKSAQSSKSAKSASPAVPAAPTHEQIAARAHELFLSSGEQPGRDEEFWLEAERQLREGVKA